MGCGLAFADGHAEIHHCVRGHVRGQTIVWVG
jgi:prepilin-type processing-associated H-X9-DG protein